MANIAGTKKYHCLFRLASRSLTADTHICATVPSISPEGRWSRLIPVPLQEVVLSQAGVVAVLREDLAWQELFEAGTEGDGDTSCLSYGPRAREHGVT